MNSLSPTVLARLQRAGWTPERQADPTPILAALRARGFAIPANAAGFFASFAGLELAIPAPTSQRPDRESLLLIDPLQAATACSPDDMRDWAGRFDDPLLPLALWNDDPSVGCLGASGALYVVYDGEVASLGGGAQGVERLVLGLPAVEVR